MEIKEWGSTETFPFCNDSSDLVGFEASFEPFFDKYLSWSDTCQLESVLVEKRMDAEYQCPTGAANKLELND